MARTKKASGEAPTDEHLLPGEKVDLSKPIDPDVVFPKDGSKLIEEIEKADRDAATANARAMVFDSANAAQEKPIDARMPKLVSRVFEPIDWGRVLDRYDAWISLGERRGEEAYIRKAHEEGPQIARDLLDVSIQVRFAREAWELENDVSLGAMREQASQVLEGEKERKIRTKMITEADVAKKCAAMFPDEWAAQEKRRLQYSLVEERSKRSYDIATLRCRHLDTMMGRLRS